MIRLTDVSLAYDSRKVLENFNLDLNEGETVMITGPNGVGKSTILRLLAKVLLPDSGTIDHGFPGGVDPRQKTAYLPDSLSFYKSMTPIEAARFHSGVFGTEPTDFQMSLMAGVNLTSRISELSVGQHVLVQMEIILSTEPELILIDEVLHSVDPYLREILFRKLISVMEERNPTVVMVNLNYREIEHLADRVIFLGISGIRLSETVDDLKMKTRKIVGKLPADYPVLLSEEIVGEVHSIVYPFIEEMTEKEGIQIKEMDLTEILTAFMREEYSVL